MPLKGRPVGSGVSVPRAWINRLLILVYNIPARAIAPVHGAVIWTYDEMIQQKKEALSDKLLLGLLGYCALGTKKNNDDYSDK